MRVIVEREIFFKLQRETSIYFGFYGSLCFLLKCVGWMIYGENFQTHLDPKEYKSCCTFLSYIALFFGILILFMRIED